MFNRSEDLQAKVLPLARFPCAFCKFIIQFRRVSLDVFEHVQFVTNVKGLLRFCSGRRLGLGWAQQTGKEYYLVLCGSISKMVSKILFGCI